jgi:hypothetical protein
VSGGTGRGLDRNIMSAYRELCEHYSPDDAIFLFGFSRGAYTVRSLAGLVTRCGVLDSSGLTEHDLWQRIERVFERGYRRKSERRDDWDGLGWRFRDTAGKRPGIRFLGVWDTVGSLGIPDDMAFLNLVDNLHDYTFHDTTLSDSVATARHAVAMDEMRATFQPTLWTSPHPDARQVWFPGVHSDVGGGYRETGLSDGALQWMLNEAERCGLAFSEAMRRQIKPDYLDVLHDSCCGVFSVLATQPRSVPSLNDEALLHPSAVKRYQDPPIHQCPYRLVRALDGAAPVQLRIYAAQPWNPTGVWLEAGETYTFKAAGEWLDSSVRSGPQGTDDGNFQLAEAAHLAGSIFGKAEELIKKVTGNKAADFRFTKRHEDMPWFCLVGAIANGGGVDAKGHLEGHEAFMIGAGCSYKPRRSGYFYAYANDAWNCYGNNRGRVDLTIS